MDRKNLVTKAKRWVIKIGSSLLTNNGLGLDEGAIAGLAAQVAYLRSNNIEVVIVSSGAVVAGISRLGWAERPKEINKLQAAAAVGQMKLIQSYERQFNNYHLQTAQVLLDHDDLANRNRYLNAGATLKSLLGLGVIPIINENDTVATDEIRFGDNDTLSALLANLIDADLLIILTDQLGMYNCDPRLHPDAELIKQSSISDPALDKMAGTTSGRLGRGGMYTKLRAAQVAARSGTDTIIVGGRIKQVLLEIANGSDIGTYLWTSEVKFAARKRWLAGQLKARGVLVLDDGAAHVIGHLGKSLLPIGVEKMYGEFKRGDIVICTDRKGNEIGQGLVNYNADSVRKVMGRHSQTIGEILGYRYGSELIHRNNFVLINS